MQRRLLLFLSMSMLLAAVFLLLFESSKRSYRLAGPGSKTTLPYQTSQPGNCTPPNYTFPKEVLISESPLPDKVKNSFQNTINITACFILNNRSFFSSSEQIEFGGTASMFEPGLFISARHIFLTTIIELQQMGRSVTIDKNGLPISDNYRYTFYGTANIKGQAVTFPLELIAMGDPYRPLDLAVFRATDPPIQLTSLKFAESARLGDIVYSSGRIPSFNPNNNDMNPIRKRVLSDFISFNFKGQISGIVTDLPNNAYAGFKKIYSIRTGLEPGFSGGPVFNEGGEIVGLTVSITPGLNFSHAISSEDQILFIKKIRDKGILPNK